MRSFSAKRRRRRRRGKLVRFGDSFVLNEQALLLTIYLHQHELNGTNRLQLGTYRSRSQFSRRQRRPFRVAVSGWCIALTSFPTNFLPHVPRVFTASKRNLFQSPPPQQQDDQRGETWFDSFRFSAISPLAPPTSKNNKSSGTASAIGKNILISLNLAAKRFVGVR